MTAKPVFRKMNYDNLGHWAKEVRLATDRSLRATLPADRMTSLRDAATTFGSAGVGTDGGFAVPAAFADKIENRINEISLAGLCDQVEVRKGGNVTLALDNDAPWNSSHLNWEGEATEHTDAKPALKQIDLKLHKLIGWIPVTSELWDDAPGLSGFLERKIALEASYLLNRAILTGSGAGQPLGIGNSPALISIAKESGQSADTIVRLNLTKMMSVHRVESAESSVWVVHPTVLAQLFESIPEAIPSGRLFGLRVITSQACEKLGDKLDIFLADFSGYLLAAHTAKIVNSMHFKYDQDLNVFRYVLRINGLPWVDVAPADRVGSGTTSNFVTLDARA